MPSSTSDIVSRDKQLIDLTELATRLERIFTDSKNVRGCFVPSYLIDALLRIDTPIHAVHLCQVTAILQKFEDNVVRSLNTNSVRFLAYLLLNLDVEEQKMGLNLLLNESSYFARPGDEGPVVSLLRLRNQSQAVDRKLSQTLYCMFVDESRDKQLRVLAGKLLVEILYESNDPGCIIFNTHHQDLSRPISMILHEDYAPLRFFASILIHILHHFQIDFGMVWHLHDTIHKESLVNCLKAHPEDPVLFFQHYDSERRRFGTILLTSCQLVQSDGDNCKVLAQGTVIVLVGTETLTFIHAITQQSKEYSQFFLISVQFSVCYVRIPPTSVHGEISQLILEFDAEVSLSLNGKRQDMGALILSLKSPTNLTDLQTIIEIAGKQSSRQSTELSSLTSVTRKISSIVIPLDTGEQIAAKSSNHEYAAEGIKQHYFLRSSISISKSPPDKPLGPKSVSHGPKYVIAIANVGASGTDGSSQVRNCDKSSADELIKNSASSNPSIEAEWKPASRNSGEKLLVASNFEKTAMDLQKNLLGCELTTDAKRVTVEDNRSREVQDHHIIDLEGKALKELPVQQNSKPQTKKQQRKRRTASTQGVGLLQLDRQESLIFPKRCPARNIHGHSRGTVDWDEDLRPTDDAEGPSGQSDSEITSVPSPLPGNISFFDRKQRKLGAKRRLKVEPLARKRRKTSKRKNRGKDTRNASEPATGRITIAPGPRPEVIGNSANVAKCHDEREHLEEKSRSEPKNPTDEFPDNTLVTDSNISGVEMDIAFLFDQAQNLGYPLVPRMLIGYHLEDTDEGIDENNGSNIESDLKCDGGIGRGKAVGKKLIAAFHDRPTNLSGHLVQKHLNHDPRVQRVVECEEQRPQENKDNEKGNDEISQHRNSTPPARKTHLSNDSCRKSSISHVNRADISSWATEPVSRHQIGKSQGCTEMIKQDNNKEKYAYHVELNNFSRKELLHQKSSQEIHVHKDRPDMQFSCNYNSSTTRDGEAKRNRPKRTNSRDGLSWIAEGQYIVEPYAQTSTSKFIMANLPVSASHNVCRTAASFNPTPRKTIVDGNGSPRLISRYTATYHDGTAFDFKHGHGESAQVRSSCTQQGVTELGFEADFEQETFNRSPKLFSFHHKLEACGRNTLSDKDETGHQALLRENKSPSEARVAKGHITNSSSDVFTLCFPILPPLKEPKPFQPNKEESAQPSSENDGNPTYSSSDSVGMSSWSELPKQNYLKKSLRSLQEKENARELLLFSNENLLRELDREKVAFGEVLDSYRQQYYDVLHQVFARQKERIRLCRQHMKTIRKHHTDLCQELLRHLQESEHGLTNKLDQED